MDENYGNIEDFDDEELHYPEEDDRDSDLAAGVVVNETSAKQSDPSHPNAALNREGAVARKRLPRPEDYPPDDIYVHPIDWHMRVPDYTEVLLREKLDRLRRVEAVDRLAQKIEEYREHHKAVDSMSAEESAGVGVTSTTTSQLMERHRAEIMQSPPIDGSPWMGVSTAENTSRVYIRLLRSRLSQSSHATSQHVQSQRTNVFSGLALEKLYKEADHLRQKMDESACLLAESVADLEDTVVPSVDATASTSSAQHQHDSCLWVDKYRPRTFVDLLSEDSVNRTVLSWLRLWDECVFSRKAPPVHASNDKERAYFETEEKKPHRPKHKILLLAGAAGLGKTTLAGVLARQAGYALTEVNASDSRNVSDFERALHSVVGQKRTVAGDCRPQILLLDEIDGAPADAINWLSKAVSVEGKKALRRPIIAICNSLYSPNLRELRQHALVITINQAKEERLVERLENIAIAERIRIDRSVLQKLVETAGCDVRLSVNTLQYVSQLRKAKEESVTEADVLLASERSQVGSMRSLFEQWHIVLEANRHNDRRGVMAPDAVRLRRVAHAWSESMDQRERFVAGLHHNYTRHQQALPVSKLSLAADCFVFYDMIQSKIQERQNYTLARYFIAFYGPLHLLLTTQSKIKVMYPQIDTNVATKRRASADCLATVRRHEISWGPLSLQLDVLPLLVVISQPAIKTVNESLLSASESRLLKCAARALSAFGVTFRPSHVNNQMHYLFDPPIDVLTMFQLNAPHRHLLANALRETLARMVELETIKQHHHEQHQDAIGKGGDVQEMDVDENADPNASTKLDAEEREKRKRKWTQGGAGEVANKDRHGKALLLSGVSLDFKPCGVNAVKTKVSLGQFLGF